MYEILKYDTKNVIYKMENINIPELRTEAKRLGLKRYQDLEKAGIDSVDRLRWPTS